MSNRRVLVCARVHVRACVRVCGGGRDRDREKRGMGERTREREKEKWRPQEGVERGFLQVSMSFNFISIESEASKMYPDSLLCLEGYLSNNFRIRPVKCCIYALVR